MVIFLSGAIAGAAVRVDDPLGCLKLDSLDLEARAALGDEVVDRYDIYAKVAAASGADARVLHLEVSRDGISVWRRDVGVAEVDCPYLASLVVLSVERGLSEVPKWVLKHGPKARLGSEIGFFLFAATPAEALRGGLTVYGTTGVGPRVRAQAALDVYAIARQEVGRGAVDVYGFALAPGLVLDVVHLGSSSLRLGGRVGGGPAFLHGQDFGSEPDSFEVRPRFSVTFDTTFAIGSYVRLTAFAEVPFVDVQLGDVGTGDVVEEPPVRVGVAVGVALPLRRD